MRRAHRAWAPALILWLMAGCGAEKEEAVWRQRPEETQGGDPFCEQVVFALHLGQYGDELAGLLFLYDGDPFIGFDDATLQGCWFLANGRVDSDQYSFNLRPSANPLPLEACPSPRFSFTMVEDERLEGGLNCGAEGPRCPLVLELGRGRPRRSCGLEGTP